MDLNIASALAIQCLPKTDGGRQEVYRMVDAAIAVIDASGLPYTVGPFETVVEGPLGRLMELAQQAHLAVLAAGSPSVSTYIKLVSGDDIGSSAEKTGKYRERGH